MTIEDQKVIGERIRRILDEKGLTAKEISEKISVTPQNFSNYLTGKRNITDKFLVKASQAIGVSFDSLRFGNESKRYDEATPIELVDEDDIFKNARGTEFRELDNGMILMTIPLVDEYAYAGYLNGWKDAEFIEELPKHSIVVDKRHSGKYRAFVVRGDSMDNDRKDAISVGDIVTGRNIDKKLWESKLHFHKYPDFVIVHQDGIVIKRIVRHDVENGIIDCTSLNEDKKFYPDFSIKLSEVYELYNIVKQEKQRGL